jgi:hypothetical protein
MAVMLDVLGQGLELGFLQKLAEGALPVPIGGEMLSVMFAQVFDFRGGVLVVDLSALVTGTTVEAWFLRGFAHIPSFAATAALLVWAAGLSRGISVPFAFSLFKQYAAPYRLVWNE